MAHLVPNKFGAGGHSSIPHPRLWITYVLPLLDAISEFPEIADNVVHQRDLKTISDEAERISNTLTQCTSLEVGKTAALKFSDALDKMMSEILKDAQKETIPNGVTIFPVNTEVHRGMQDTQSEQVGFLQQELPKFGPINRSVERTHVNENKMEQLSKEPYSFGAQNALFSYADQLPETIVSTSEVSHEENEPGSPFVSYLHRIDKVSVNSRAVFNLDYNPLQWSEKHGLIKITKLNQREIDKKSGKHGSAFFNMKEGAGHDASRADYIVVRTLFTPVELTFTEQCSHSVAGKSLAGGELGEIQVVADCYDGDKKHEPKHLKLTPAFWGVLSSGDITVGPVVIKNASDLFSLINHELNRQQIKLRGAFHDYVRESFNGGRGPKYDDFIAEWEAVAGALMGATRVRALLAGADSSQAEAKGDTSILEYLPIFTRPGPNGETSLWQLIELFLSETFSNQNLNDMITNNVDYSDHIQHVISSKLSSFPDTESLLSSFFQACWGNSGTPTTPAQITSLKILIDSISTLDLATLRG